jgi:hypothetical protein
MTWWLVIVFLTADGETAGMNKKKMASAQECRRAVDQHEPKVMSGALYVMCRAEPSDKD